MKIFIIKIILLLLVFNLVTCEAGALTVDEAALQEGIMFVDDLYDSQKATERFREVLVSETAPDKLKIEACFWLAHTHLFEGEQEKAKQAISEIFEIKPDTEYDFLSVLPDSTKGNNKLMYLFNQKREANAADRESQKIEEVQEEQKEVRQESKKQEAGEKRKLSFGKMIIGTLMTAAYIVLVVLL